GLFLSAAALDAQPVTPTSGSPQVIATGAGEARVAPDRATIYIGVQSRAPTASAAGADNARRQRAVIDTLRALGLAGDRVPTPNRWLALLGAPWARSWRLAALDRSDGR